MISLPTEDFFVAVKLENKNAAIALIFAAVPRCCGGKKMLPAILLIQRADVSFNRSLQQKQRIILIILD